MAAQGLPPALQEKIAELQKGLNEHMANFNNSRQKYALKQQQRQQLVQQMTELEFVQAEFDAMAEGEIIYKHIGPILVRQPRDEAVQNVEERLSVVKRSLAGVDKETSELEKEITGTKSAMAETHATAQRLIEAHAAQQQASSGGGDGAK
eukprot:TRINITY_DN46659_c0_g1_i1.p1 TRINITY_DN46659_c0_g1~~TRINITY_DN46659_c0_g1_i1.p1  ORF type:complete len:150 (+),score=33.01 TRINITY_DN46659_c0_g1_i1:92-541(+)